MPNMKALRRPARLIAFIPVAVMVLSLEFMDEHQDFCKAYPLIFPLMVSIVLGPEGVGVRNRMEFPMIEGVP